MLISRFLLHKNGIINVAHAMKQKAYAISNSKTLQLVRLALYVPSLTDIIYVNFEHKYST